MEADQFNPDIVRAALPLAVLSLLAERPAHGYALVEQLRALGFDRTQGGTLYPLLKRFEDAGLVTHEWLHDEAGPGRKQFSLTEAGRAQRDAASMAWLRVTDILTGLSPAPEEATE